MVNLYISSVGWVLCDIIFSKTYISSILTAKQSAASRVRPDRKKARGNTAPSATSNRAYSRDRERIVVALHRGRIQGLHLIAIHVYESIVYI